MLNHKKLFELISLYDLKKAYLLIGMFLIMAILDTIGVASVMPFIAVVTNPSLIETNNILNHIFNILTNYGIDTKREFFLVLGFISFTLLVLSLTFKALTIYFQLRFISICEYKIAKKLFKGYLNQHYVWFLDRNSAHMGKSILAEVKIVINSGISPILNLIAQTIIAITLVVLLLIADSKLAMIVSLTLIFSYFLIYKFTRKYLKIMGEQNLEANKLKFSILNEAFGASKEIKFSNLEDVYVDRFSSPSKVFAKNYALSSAINQIPRFLLEIIGFGGILLTVLYLISQKGDFSKVIPILALYTLAAYRLMPAFQQIFGAISQLRYVGPALNYLHSEIYNNQSKDNEGEPKKFHFKEEINLKNIFFNYPNSSKTILDNVSLKISALSTVAFIGSTGSGKSTLIDIMVGLLKPQKGTLEIDGKVIDGNNDIALKNIAGYVPQHIFLSDDTIASNIAFGVNPENIDYDKIQQVAKIANIHDFVMNDLPLKYQTNVGERGIKLSGGQRQRLGIARALYNNPQVLVLDEATSALDNITEKMVMDSINKLKNKITIILIAHRLTTVKNCDNIFLLESGKIKKQGKFSELKIEEKYFFELNKKN